MSFLVIEDKNVDTTNILFPLSQTEIKIKILGMETK